MYVPANCALLQYKTEYHKNRQFSIPYRAFSKREVGLQERTLYYNNVKGEGKIMSDKTTIMKFLKECSDLKEQYSLLEAREYYLTNTIKKIDTGPSDSDIPYKNSNESIAVGVVLSSLLLGLMGTPFAAIIIAIFARPARFLYETFNWTFAHNHPFWTHILFSFVVVSILAIPLAILMCKDQKKGSLERFKSYQSALALRPGFVKELADIQAKKQSIQLRLKQLASQGVLHPDYMYYTDKLWWYFEKGRADTLKEAINLLERDLDEEDRREAEKEYQNMMRKQVQQQQETLDYIAGETGRAADAAQSAAAWSAAGTLLTAAEIERQRKKDRG